MSAPVARLRAPFKIPKTPTLQTSAAASATRWTFGARTVISRSRPTTELDATEFDREALRLVVTSDVTDFYSQILSLNDRIRIAEFNLKNAEEILRIIEARFAQGGVSGLEVSQQRVAVNGFRTALTDPRRSPQHYGQCAGDSARQLRRKICLRLRPTLASLKMPQVNLTPPATLVDRAARHSKRRGRLRAPTPISAWRGRPFFPHSHWVSNTAVAAGFGGPAGAATSLASSLLAPIFTGGATYRQFRKRHGAPERACRAVSENGATSPSKKSKTRWRHSRVTTNSAAMSSRVGQGIAKCL